MPFEVLSFDVYGTLVDWESGILAALEPVLASRQKEIEPERLLEAYGRLEAEIESGSYLPYREVLAAVLRGLGKELDFEPNASELERFSTSIREWPVFADSTAALRKLHERHRLGLVTNCDDDLLAFSLEKLGVDFDFVVTAEQVRSYKPDPAHFLAAFEKIGLPRERILHVAQSLYHDHVPAKQLGLTTAWVNRRAARAGFGATPPAQASPDIEVPDMQSLAKRLA